MDSPQPAPPPRKPPADKQSGPHRRLTIGMALMIPSLLTAGPFVGYGLGILLQKYLGLGDWVYPVMILFGLGIGIRESVKVIRKLSREL